MRRAEYSGGDGRLSVDEGWLLFICDDQHAAVEDLEQAARSEHPGRSLATAVTQSGFMVPPFVFARVGERIHGIVYGQVELFIDDGDMETVDGAAADPWAHFDASASASLMCGESEFNDGFWVERGVVCADSFRWAHRSGGSAVTDRSELSETAFEENRTEPDSAAIVDSAPNNIDPDSAPVEAEISLLDAFNSEFDSTIDAIRFAEVRGDSGDLETGRPKRREDRAELGATDAEPVSEMASDTETEVGVDDQDATIDLGPGQVMLDSLHAERRTVEALVCTTCENPNPPSVVRCRHCGAPLSSKGTEIRQVPQPVLGVIHLSGNREELLDADLLIGRNPGYSPLERYQRAVVHAEEDRSVSRRHIELKLEQWRVMAINLSKSARTVLESRDGRRTKLTPEIPQQLRSGDTVHYGGAWLRFEAEE